MAEANGGNARLEAARKEMEDAMIVMAHLEAKAASRIQEHAEFIATIEAGIKSHESRIAEREETSDLLGQRVDKLVLAIGDLISRIPPASFSN
jgi:septal ring factor EnvC (AmiA/AmiB activator)